jgi:hypothetical protein
MAAVFRSALNYKEHTEAVSYLRECVWSCCTIFFHAECNEEMITLSSLLCLCTDRLCHGSDTVLIGFICRLMTWWLHSSQFHNSYCCCRCHGGAEALLKPFDSSYAIEIYEYHASLFCDHCIVTYNTVTDMMKIGIEILRSTEVHTLSRFLSASCLTLCPFIVFTCIRYVSARNQPFSFYASWEVTGHGGRFSLDQRKRFR